MIIRLFDAIDEYNTSKQREVRRPTSEVGATYDGSPCDCDRRYTSSSRSDPGDGSHCESEGEGEASIQTTTKTERYSKLKIYILNIINTSS